MKKEAITYEVVDDGETNIANDLTEERLTIKSQALK